MARLIKGIEADSLFKNKRSVEKAMEERNGLTNELIESSKPSSTTQTKGGRSAQT
jgi:hypothetical protein